MFYFIIFEKSTFRNNAAVRMLTQEGNAVMNVYSPKSHSS